MLRSIKASMGNQRRALVVFLLCCGMPLLLQKGSCSTDEAHIHYTVLQREETLNYIPTTASICSSNGNVSSEEGSTVLKLVSRFGPCSPSASPTPTRNTVDLHRDQARAKWIQARALGRSRLDDKATTLPAYSGSSLDTLEFIVTIGLGTPKQNFQVLFDTGSDLTWVQCEPCLVSCHPQKGPRFSPSNSSTFRYYSCDSAQCKELVSENYESGCSNSRCLYGILYGDGSTTTGFFGSDALTLGDGKFSGFPFGCGEKNKGLFGKEAGLLGLGRNKLSLVSFASGRYGGVFSYCLPTTSSPGFLTFGSDNGSKTASYTPLLTRPLDPSFYYVSLVGLYVGGKKLNIPSSTFSNPGTILDSGTILTYLPSTAYAALRSEFKQRMSMYTPSGSFGSLDTCYDFSGYRNVSSPVIVLSFAGGTNLVLDFKTTMIQVSNTRYCLAFIPNSELGIIGNWQQRKTQIVHDLAKSRIGFRPRACT